MPLNDRIQGFIVGKVLLVRPYVLCLVVVVCGDLLDSGESDDDEEQREPARARSEQADE